MIWSYTLLNTYLICPHQAMHRYVLKDVPFVESAAMAHGNAVHKALEHRLKGRPLPAEHERFEPLAKQLEPHKPAAELMLGVKPDGSPCDFFANDVWGRGKLDVVVRQNNTAALYDWKTGKVREEPFELEVQALLLKSKYPHLTKIVGNYIWLADNMLGVTYDLSDVQKTWVKVNQILSAMHAEKAEWRKTPGPLCGFCAVKACEHNKNGQVR